jgi:hypothetical protein
LELTEKLSVECEPGTPGSVLRDVGAVTPDD